MNYSARTFLFLAAIAISLVSGGILWLDISDIDREAPIRAAVPRAHPPVPNAYELYTAAGRAIIGAEQVRDAAASLRPAAISGFRGRLGYTVRRSDPNWEGSQPTAEMRSLIARNAEALSKIRKGLAGDCWNTAGRDSPADRPDDHDSLDVALDLLTLQGKIRTCDRDWRGAVEAFVDVIDLECAVTRGGSLPDTQFSTRRQWRPRRYVWQLLPRLDAGSARRNARRVETITAKLPSFAAVLVEQKYSLQRMLLHLTEDPEWRQVIADKFELPSAHGYLAEKARARSISKRELFDTYTRSMDLAIARARKPYALRGSRLPISRDPFFYWLWHEDAEGTYDYRLEWEHARASNGLLAVGLALRAYQAEHGRYPESLRALVPAYLTNLPSDPFAVKATFRYRLDGPDYVLYSLGANCRDDGGEPGMGGGYRRADPRARGDLVAGVRY